MDAEIIMKNMFEVFDSNNTGKIVPNELLWIFSMSMKGKGKWPYVNCNIFLLMGQYKIFYLGLFH